MQKSSKIVLKVFQFTKIAQSAMLYARRVLETVDKSLNGGI